MTEIIGSAEHYAQFLKLCRTRIVDLGVTYDSVDAICGFSDGYTGKVLCGEKAVSIYSFFTLVRALALTPNFVNDEMQLNELQRREHWIKSRRAGARFRNKHSGATHFQIGIDFYRQIGQKGGIAKNSRARKFREWGRKGAAARWNGK